MLQLPEIVEQDPCPRDPAETPVWRERVRTRLATMLGPPPEPVPLDVELTDTVDAGDHLRHRIVYDVDATMSVPAFLMVPTSRLGSDPGTAVLAVHGHGPGKDLICGLTGPTHEHYALQLVRAGHVVLAPDLRYVHSSATDEDKATYIERACTGWYDYRSLKPLRREWRVWGDTALCNGDVAIEVIVKGTTKSFTSRYLQVWRREAGGWRMASWQSTPVPV
jgi:hypothetical protein